MTGCPVVASSGYFSTSDGVRLHYLEAGQGPPVVWLPGWTQPASGFAEPLGALSDAYRIPGARLVMLDARHFVHLESPGPFHAAVRSFLEEIDEPAP